MVAKDNTYAFIKMGISVENYSSCMVLIIRRGTKANIYSPVRKIIFQNELCGIH